MEIQSDHFWAIQTVQPDGRSFCKQAYTSFDFALSAIYKATVPEHLKHVDEYTFYNGETGITYNLILISVIK